MSVTVTIAGVERVYESVATATEAMRVDLADMARSRTAYRRAQIRLGEWLIGLRAHVSAVRWGAVLGTENIHARTANRCVHLAADADATGKLREKAMRLGMIVPQRLRHTGQKQGDVTNLSHRSGAEGARQLVTSPDRTRTVGDHLSHAADDDIDFGGDDVDLTGMDDHLEDIDEDDDVLGADEDQDGGNDGHVLESDTENRVSSAGGPAHAADCSPDPVSGRVRGGGSGGEDLRPAAHADVAPDSAPRQLMLDDLYAQASRAMKFAERAARYVGSSIATDKEREDFARAVRTIESLGSMDEVGRRLDAEADRRADRSAGRGASRPAGAGVGKVVAP